jgi:hypothetical protein
MREISVWRLHLLRAAYLLLVIGLGVTIWPTLFSHGPDWPRMNSVVVAMLCALSALSVLGLRYPLQMIPLLLFELTWKGLWLGFVAAPLFLRGELDGAWASTASDCLVGLVFLVLIPWDYVFANYVARKGDPWRRS